ncbi:RteC domain-containing protein [Flavobacterium adhaerens]|uniref:RteC domain-containing protein n=1 Tax=Flavobacterium adhaerens TaxID=3149043 RepID=UPI0032B4A103
MNEFQNLLLEEFTTKVNNLDNAQNDQINQTVDFIIWAESKVEELHKWLKHFTFENEEDEIYFFKETKPRIISKLIFQKEVLRIETNAPLGKVQKKIFFEKAIKKLSSISSTEIKFYQYYRSATRELDNVYFTRKTKKNILETECFLINTDLRLTTCYDYKVAKIIANDDLVKYLEKELQNLEDNYKVHKHNSKLHWSGTKTDLVELIYALHSQKIINNGKTDIKEIATELGKAFNIELNDSIYRSFIDIKGRKNSKTKFIDSLSKNFNKQILDEDF